jgi:gamma-glutamyl:cysteine ligase YbdK (ATP-grasp superfamily)
VTEDAAPLRLFEGYGIELEYMIVGRDDLSVRPIADEVLKQVAGEYAMEVECGEIAWSNELALHVIELKTNGPARDLAGLDAPFQANVERINTLLEPMEACLLPTAMHPWMNPFEELRLWPHENDVIYETFNRIFDCRGHGWANLQSTHINLPFANDAEFGSLHAAIRLVLPLIPGLAASSPVVDGRISELLDTRLQIYRTNARRVPSVAGLVIPERVFTRRDYEEGLLPRIYADLAPLDPDGVLRHEWVNARGAIARFDRMAIEIRIVDVQECPAADIAVASAVVAAVRCLVEEHWASSRAQREWDERRLAALLNETMRHADRAVIDDLDLLESFGYPERGRTRLADLWQHLVETLLSRPRRSGNEPSDPLGLIIEKGCLARRIVDALDAEPTLDELREVYARLASCLGRGASFTG